jgi:parvulin-like peptidyl-prolyl isomerase
VRKQWGQIAALSAVLVTGFTLTACGGIAGDAVVSVNGKSITKATLEHWVGIAASSSSPPTGTSAPKPVVPDPPAYRKCIAHLQATLPKPAKGQVPPTEATLKTECEQQYTSLKQEVLGFLISADWVLGEAEEQGVKVSDAEVTKHFDTVKSQQFPKEANFQKFLQSTGQTVSDLLLRVKLNLLSTKIQQKVTKASGKKPSQHEIAAYYEQHKQQFGQPERRNLLVVLTKTKQQAEKAEQEIRSGKSFSSVAKKSSIDPVSKSAGGVLNEVPKGQEAKGFDEAIFKAKPSSLTGPVKTPFGYYVFEVKKVLPATEQALAQVQSTIQQQLTAQGQQKALSEFVKNFRKKWTARTECRSEYMVPDCKGYKAPKTPSLPTVTPSQTTSTPPPATGTTKK